MRKFVYLFVLMFSIEGLFAQTAGNLTFTFNTSSHGGQYANRHILAVWITNSSTNGSSSYIKTLISYYKNLKYRQYLTKWRTATSTYDVTDAITGATLTSYSPLTGRWKGTNTMSATVPDGTYYIWVEFTESNATGPYAVFSFTKGSEATSTYTTVSSSSNITPVSLSWAPVVNDLQNIEADKNIVAYPNPATNLVTISGIDMTSANLYNATGKLVATVKTNSIDISQQPKGIYIVEIVSPKGKFYRKIEKN